MHINRENYRREVSRESANANPIDLKNQFEKIVNQVSRVIFGKKEQIQHALTCLLANGHLLIEDHPGIGKTTLARGLAKSLGLNFQRVQFTNDLLPGDILGVSVYEQQNNSFKFHPGPIFTNVLLADEINRGTPKTQSALLEAMEERQITIEGQTRNLPCPFLIIATQNPSEHHGVFPLPDSQIDRFLFRIDLGYPLRDNEKSLLEKGDTKTELDNIVPVFGPERILEIQKLAGGVHASSALHEYVLDILEFTRSSDRFFMGLSPRAGLGIIQAARARAFIDGRDFVIPEDVQAVTPAIVRHRLRSREDRREYSPEMIKSLMREVPVP